MAIDVLNENDNVPVCRTYAEVYNVREDTGRSKVILYTEFYQWKRNINYIFFIMLVCLFIYTHRTLLMEREFSLYVFFIMLKHVLYINTTIFKGFIEYLKAIMFIALMMSYYIRVHI